MNTQEYSTQTAYDLLDAFKQDGCPVCSLALKSVSHFMDATNYDGVSDEGMRNHLKAALGFCNTHAHQWLHAAFILGTAEIYRDILLVISDQLREHAGHEATDNETLSSLLFHHHSSNGDILTPPYESCPACAHLATTEDMLITTIVHELYGEPFRTAYLRSPGLCIPHLRLAFTASADAPAVHAVLRTHALQREEHILTQLEEIIRKHDYRFRQEPIGDERGAASRAVAHVAGAYQIAKIQIV